MPRVSSLSSRSLTGIGIRRIVEWILSAAAYTNKSFSVATQDTSPAGITFKKDGTIMYIAGRTNASVRQYTLSTPWDVSTASFANKSISVSAQLASLNNVEFKDDGTIMYVVGWFTPSIFQYTLTTAWDVSTATYSGTSYSYSSASGIGSSAYGLRFSSDGSKFYINGDLDTIFQFNLSTPWDVSTASYANKSKFVGVSGNLNPTGIDFKYDGTIMFVQDTTAGNNRQITAWTMSTPWDISTATENTTNKFSVGTQDPNPYDFYMRYDGLGFYVVGPNNDTVYQYSMGAFSQPLYTYTSVVAPTLPANTLVSFYGSTGQSNTVTNSRLSLITTAQARFGTRSLQKTPNNSGSRANAVNVPLSQTMGAPLTVEAWVYLTVGADAPNFEQGPALMLHGPAVDVASVFPTNFITVGCYGANTTGFSARAGVSRIPPDGTGSSTNDQGNGGIPLNTWTHIALSYSNSTNFAVWINGTRRLRNTWGAGYGLNAVMTQLTLNSESNVGPHYIDEVRVSNIDRYGVDNTTITVPTSAFVSDANTTALISF